MGKWLAALALTTALATGNVQAEGNKTPDFSGLVESGNPAVAKVIGDTQAKIAPLTAETKIILAEAETDGKVYTAEVVQIDGTKKVVKYYRDKDGAIIPPPVIDGKLVDGSDAPAHPLRAKNAQVKILAKYDKIILARSEKKDLISKANSELDDLTTLAEQSKLDKNGLYNSFSATYIVILWLGDDATPKNITWLNTIMSWLEKYWRIVLKLSPSEIEQMKKKAEQDAQNKLSTFAPSAA